MQLRTNATCYSDDLGCYMLGAAPRDCNTKKPSCNMAPSSSRNQVHEIRRGSCNSAAYGKARAKAGPEQPRHVRWRSLAAMAPRPKVSESGDIGHGITYEVRPAIVSMYLDAI